MDKDISNKRKIVYNVLSNPEGLDNERHTYWFFIVNEPREIDFREQLIHENLMPIIDETLLDKGVVLNTGGRLSYKLFRFDSSKYVSVEEIKKGIYSGEFKRDKRLDDRITTIENYPQKWIS